MSRAREIERLRREMDLLGEHSFAERPNVVDHEALLEQERARHRQELDAVRNEAEAAVRMARQDARRAVREEGARLRVLLGRHRSRAEALRRDVARLTASLRAARQEAAGHRMLRRELEVRLRAAEDARDAAVDRGRELLAIVQELVGAGDHGDRVISLEERAAHAVPRR